MRLDVRGLDHLHFCGASLPRQFTEQPFPDVAARPAREPIVYRRAWTVGFGAVAPPAATLQNVHDAADHAAIVLPLYAAYVRRQATFDSLPLFVSQPKSVSAHNPALPGNESILYYRRRPG